MPSTSERLCRYCGEPLPVQKGRSRPRVAHEGECSRKYHNRRRLNWRIERFRAAHRIDRSDECPWATNQYGRDDISPDGYMTSRGAYDDVHGRPLIEAMNAWEQFETIRKAVLRAEHEAREQERQAFEFKRRRRENPVEWNARLKKRLAYWQSFSERDAEHD